MEYQDNQLTNALRSNNYYKASQREVLHDRVIITVCVLSVLFFLGRTLVTYYQLF